MQTQKVILHLTSFREHPSTVRRLTAAIAEPGAPTLSRPGERGLLLFSSPPRTQGYWVYFKYTVRVSV